MWYVMEIGTWFKVSSKRPEMRRIKLGPLRVQVLHANHYTMAAAMILLFKYEEKMIIEKDSLNDECYIFSQKQKAVR